MCKGKSPDHLKLFSFNVEGLKPKLEDPDFLETNQDCPTKTKNAIRHSPYLPDITLDQV